MKTIPPRPRRRRLPVRAASIFSSLVMVATLCLLLLSYLGTAASAAPSVVTPGVVLTGQAKAQVGDLQAQAKAVQTEIDRLDTQIEQYTEDYNQISVRVDATNVELFRLRRQLDAARTNYDYRRAVLEQRVVAAYKARDNDVLEILLATHDFSDFVKRCILVTKVAMNDQRIVENVKSSTAQLVALEGTVKTKKRDGLRLREQLDGRRLEIEARLADRQATMKGLDQRIAALAEQERVRQEAERKALEANLRSQLAGWQRYDGPLPQVDDQILRQFVETAATYLGIPYVWTGDRPSSGLDCSGFTSYVFRQHGIELPHYSGYQSQMGVPVSLADIRAGDLLAFGNPVHHVGIYIGGGQFIHAPHTGDVVRISVLATRNDLAAIRRFPLKARLGPPALD